MDETQMEIDIERDGAQSRLELASQAETFWQKKQYSQCHQLLTRKDYDNPNYEEDLRAWIVKNNDLACQLKILSNSKNLLTLEREFCELLEQIQGVPTSLEVVCLEVLVTHNLLACILNQYLGMCKSSGSAQTCSKHIDKYLSECLGKVGEFLGCTQAQINPLNINIVCLDILEKMRNKSDTVLSIIGWMLTLNCSVYFLCNSMPRVAIEVLKVFQSTLPDHNFFLPCTFKPSEIVLEISLNNLTKSVTLSQNVECFTELATSFQDLYISVLFATGDYTTCFEQLEVAPIHVKFEDFAYLKAYMLFKQKRFSECLQLCSDMKERVYTDSQSRWYNMLGSCLQKEDKHQTAIQVFSQAMNSNTTLLPLYNMSVMYRIIDVTEAELECLNLLLDALKNQNSKHVPNSCSPVIVLCGSNIVQHRMFAGGVYSAHVLYVLAKRCLELKRFETATSHYRDLIACLANCDGVENWQSFATKVDIPRLCTIQKEMAYCLLHVRQYTDCVTRCDELLKATAEREIKTFSANTTGLTESLTGPQTVYHGKRKNLSAPLSFEQVKEKVYILLVKADAFANQCKYVNAISCINKAIEYSQEYLFGEQDSNRKQLNKSKRLDTAQLHTSKQTELSTDTIRENLKDAYVNKASILVAMGNLKDAVHMSRLAVQLNPKCGIALYNHTLILLTSGRWKDACHAWLPFRDITPDPYTLRDSLESRSKKLVELESTVEPQEIKDLHLCVLSDVEKTRLDVHLLEILQQKTKV